MNETENKRHGVAWRGVRGRQAAVHFILAAAWLAIAGWQAIEHLRVRETARQGLLGRGRDITTTLGLVIRSQRRFGSVFQDRIEPALEELVKTAEVESIHLLNKSDVVVASAGGPLDLTARSPAGQGERWDSHSVTVVNLMDLGTRSATNREDDPPIIVLPRRDPGGSNALGGGDPFRFPWRGGRPPDTNGPDLFAFAPFGPPRQGPPEPPPPERPREGPGRRGFGRPPWMSEEQYKQLITRQGVHSFVVVLSTLSVERAIAADLWARAVVAILGAVAVAGVSLAWRNTANSAQLKLRLLRASELNNHLREMNIAAAGLAHETRNPLNIVRGLAQMISKRDDAPQEIRQRAYDITSEVDRVTDQLNQFINYSKPRDVKSSIVILDRVVDEVVRALGADLEEKRIRLTFLRADLRIIADDQMLRQTLFNLVINAIQALGPDDQIEISSGRSAPSLAFLEIRDTGPGVAESDRSAIFKPYFTRRSEGTGLGLAVVHQIVLAHGWDIECVANEPRGAVFRIHDIKLASTAT
ncbi:MAG: hypothetical protein HY299_03800 [Verrucomicrobia bacterium]|nr:hypothetical protein [Verrucomicrobiota bacterium]